MKWVHSLLLLNKQRNKLDMHCKGIYFYFLNARVRIATQKQVMCFFFNGQRNKLVLVFNLMKQNSSCMQWNSAYSFYIIWILHNGLSLIMYPMQQHIYVLFFNAQANNPVFVCNALQQLTCYVLCAMHNGIC